MKKLTVLEWLAVRREFHRRRWEKTTDLERKVRYGAQKAELDKVLDYIAAGHPLGRGAETQFAGLPTEKEDK